MIVRPRPHWLRMLFVVRGSILNRIAPQLLCILLLSVLVVSFHGQLLHHKITLTAVPFSLVGVALAIFLGFRNSASYDRYWEARKLWGRLLTDARSAARLAVTMTDAATARPFVLGLAAFVHAARHQFRGRSGEDDLRRLLPADVADEVLSRRFVAMAVLLWLSRWVREQRDAGRLDSVLAMQIDQSLTGLNDAYGGCERIAYTPLPFTYSVILHRTVYLYCLMLPFGLLDSIGVMTPLMVTFVAYTFFAIEALGDEIEEPFGTAPNDLALDAMSVNIEASVRELLGDRDLPAPHKPIDCVLT
ncbi:MAG: bestrophin family ion channel [Sphaerotilus natans]